LFVCAWRGAGRNILGNGHGREQYDRNSIEKMLVGEFGGSMQSESRLANATRANQRDKRLAGIAEVLEQNSPFDLTPNHGRRRGYNMRPTAKRLNGPLGDQIGCLNLAHPRQL